MDLSLLRGFVAGVRVELVGVVGARLAGVLLPGSVERVEFPEAVRRLEGVVARSGRDVVVDQVAYTWFNRLVALRFMDVNGYTGVGVVSPGGGAVAGQPEVLADAKAGHVDVEVVGEKGRDRVIGLLSGSVVSGDAQGEAFKLLLAAYCNHWAGPMPFMFERSGDFTELLVPDDLLSDRSIVARIVRTLTPEICSDVEVIGWLYQFYIAARKDEVFAGFKKNKKATALEIPAATQLFTPHWIVKYLVENSLGRVWLLNNPGSDLASGMEYYIAPVEPETDFLRISGPEALKVLDPACGSGHMLTYAFDLLFLMYEEAGYAPSDIPGLILKHNLFGAEIDPRAGALAAFALVMKARGVQKSFLNPGKGTEPNICVLEPVRFTADELETLVTRGGDKHAEVAFWQAFEDADTFGSLIRPNQDLIAPLKAHVESLGEAETLFGGDVLDRARTVIRQSVYLSTRYHVVVANPPYMDSRNLSGDLAEKIKRKMTAFSSGLDVAFVGRSSEWVVEGGYFSLLTMDSWLANEECVEARSVMRWLAPVVTLLHLGSRAFPEISGEVVRVAATCFRRSAATETPGTYIDAVSGKNEAEKRLQFADPDRRYSHLPQWFDVFPKRPLSAFPATETVRNIFADGTTLDSLAEVKTGLQTGDNGRYLRNWHELGLRSIRTHSDGRERWVPYVKNRNARRWYASEEFVIDWGDGGSKIRDNASAVFRNSEKYFLPGISFNGIGKQLKASVIAAGRVFDQQNSMLFYEDNVDPRFVVALLNSGTFADLVSLISPKRFNIGAMRKVPVVAAHLPEDHAERIARAIWIQSIREAQTESSIDFRAPLLALKRQEATLLESEFERTRRETADLRLELSDIEKRNTQFFNMLYSLKTTTAMEGADAAADESEGDDGPLGTISEGDDGPLGTISDLVSFAVGCMFGRYSLDAPGLVLANQRDTLADYLAKVPSPSFMPDEDNVLPVLSDGWFEDDIVERFREFLKVSFGEEHFEENLRFVEEALGKDIRKYFVQDFYKDHVQRYKKRPIYWMFSSPKGSFNALIYMHRYRPDAVSVVLNDYLHEFQAKLRARRANLDQVTVSTLSAAKEQTAARKESEQIGKTLLELGEWEQSVLYPLATEQIAIDLDDGVKVNYPKFGAALHNKFTGF